MEYSPHPDQIIIRGLRVFAGHGVHDEEKRKGQIFVLDIVVTADLSDACRTDRVADTVSYSQVARAAAQAMQERGWDLIERAAQYVVDRLFAQFPKIGSVDITLKKPRAPVAADFEYVAVELFRTRKGFSPEPDRE